MASTPQTRRLKKLESAVLLMITEATDPRSRSQLLNGRASASGAGDRVFESKPRHTKSVKMVQWLPCLTLTIMSHALASLLTNIAQLTS